MKKLKLSDFDYYLPKELIAKVPEKKRDHSRLLVLDKKAGDMQHKHFFDIVDYLNEGDVLVLNNSKVFPARLIGRRQGSGGKVEIFLHKKIDEGQKTIWECLVGARRVKPGLVVEFEKGLEAKIIQNNGDGTWLVEFDMQYEKMMKVVEAIGRVPIPPYIGKSEENRKKYKVNDKKSYQTVYASDAKVGSVAAPTAGLHFTSDLLQKIKDKGIIIKYITLHVGMGTFSAVKTENIEEHQMHAEYVEVDKETILTIMKAKKDKRRIIGIGTTSVRTLEAVFEKLTNKEIESVDDFSAWVNIFIYPGYKFRVIDAMITNFHLPKSSLIMLVSALAGKDNIDKAYEKAIETKYRFYSYGDAMFIV